MGAISEAVPSTPVFEMYPMGFAQMAHYLEKNGIRARIVNLALKMLNDEKFDPDIFIKKLDSEAFCIDLHWIAHLHGALECAKICKKHHPEIPVIFGGFTSTYYSDEILQKFPCVDYVLRGDSCDLPLLKLIENLNSSKKNNQNNPGNLEKIPNLSFREGTKIRSNPISNVDDSIDFVIDPKFMLKLILRDRDLDANLPYKSWLDDPTMPILTSKGCIYNCVCCGGSKDCYESIYNRKKPALMQADKVIEQMMLNEQYINNPVFFLNDIRMGGKKYYREIFKKIKQERIDLPVVFELFSPLDREFAGDLKASFSHYNLEMSPEDASESVRLFAGKTYTNDDVERSIKNAINYGCDKIDLFFMIGLGGQSRDNVYQTLKYIDSIAGKFKNYNKNYNGNSDKSDGDNKNKIYPFISPYAPTIDPGSIAFESPEKYGYVVFNKTLESQYEAFKKLSWKEFFNYRTQYLSAGDIVELTYDSALKLADIKKKYHIISDEDAQIFKRRVYER